MPDSWQKLKHAQPGKGHTRGLTDLPCKLERGLAEAIIASTEMRKSSRDDVMILGNKIPISVNQVVIVAEALETNTQTQLYSRGPQIIHLIRTMHANP
jgi:hypothetical protein